jgi:hypothetical protein
MRAWKEMYMIVNKKNGLSVNGINAARDSAAVPHFKSVTAAVLKQQETPTGKQYTRIIALKKH